MEHFIHGHWKKTYSKQYIEVINPCTGELVGTCARGNEEDVNIAMKSAHNAFTIWKMQTTAHRASLQHNAAQLMRQKADFLGKTLASELGRPLAACIHEINRSAELLDYYAQEALRMNGEVLGSTGIGEKVLIVRQPVGVVVALTPFNYPITLLIFKLGAALVMGCTVVAKPSEDTPLSTLYLAEIFKEAGYPDGIFNVITGFGHEIGNALITHRHTAKVAFTGGTATGQKIGALATQHGKRITLELGGQSPAIICEDADLATAVPALVKHAFANSGQFCYRVNRIYVHETLHDAFVTQFCDLAQQLKVGDAFALDTDMGAMINEKIYRNSEIHVADALKYGAKIRIGGKRLTGGMYDKGWYFPPTVITDTEQHHKIMCEETFGPVVGIKSVKDNDEAIQYANETPYGLAAYVFSQQLGTGLRLAERLEAGSVWVNNIHRSYHNAPFGGMKQSGIGREKGRYGLEDYTELKTIYLNY